jgi:ppGpp synthetase/RelA/SpoT-type nucleotidyltranferase
MTNEAEALAQRYQDRVRDLGHVASRLREEFESLLEDQAGIERVEFRVKAVESFVTKAMSSSEGKRRYASPLEEIEDQVGGRVMALFKSTIDEVLPKLTTRFATVESLRKQPRVTSFGYESHHLVFQIPPEAYPPGWANREDKIETFEVQVRTLFMHAWAEVNHDLGYKGGVLTEDQERELAWAAASAWGADNAFDRVRASIAQRRDGAAGPHHKKRPTRF